MFEVPSVSRLLIAFAVVVAVLTGLAYLVTSLDPDSDLPTYPYSEMLADAAAGRVVSIVQEGNQLRVTTASQDSRIVRVASDTLNVYAEVCAATGNEPGPSCPIQYEVVAESGTGRMLEYLISSLVPVILIGAFFFFMMRAARQKKE
jgi:ATP-dependent Zn protease